ncbi:MAG: hypothetical protein ACREEP_03365 [Dongiaceae bacterium]
MSLRGGRVGWTVCCALIFLTAFVWAVGAQTADPACQQLEAILSQRNDGFSALQEAPLESPNQSVTSTFLFLDSQDCKIISSFSSPEAGAYSCEWKMADNTIAQQKFFALRDMVKLCRSDLAVNDESLDPNEPGMLFIVTNDDTYIAIGMVTESNSGEPAQHRVGIDILSAQGFANWKALLGE